MRADNIKRLEATDATLAKAGGVKGKTEASGRHAPSRRSGEGEGQFLRR